MNHVAFPRVVISALRGGSGKTILSVGILAALRALGKQTAPFKKGPDYIDAGWLALAAGRPCHNLDTFLVEKDTVLRSFLTHTPDGHIAVVEGNRGLYDGIDSRGTTSTAELAKLLKAPVVLCVDCTKSTRTMAAAVLGCTVFDREVAIRGVILNHVAGRRHEEILRKSIEEHCGIPVLGAVPKLSEQPFPERHMGLTPTPEHAGAMESVLRAGEIARKHLDLQAILRIAREAQSMPLPMAPGDRKSGSTIPQVPCPPRIGIIRDSAFQFYYPENIDALREEGAEILYISPLRDETIPDVDALYIGGGFPETHAEMLAQRSGFSRRLKNMVDEGLPVYAECGGLMYLGEALILDEKRYPMAGVLPVVFGLCQRPQGHGYTVVSVDRENPYYDVGAEIRGHEFHYSKVLEWRGSDGDLVFSMKRGTGISNRRDGIRYRNVLATYTHVHALGTPQWARALVRNAAAYSLKKSDLCNRLKRHGWTRIHTDGGTGRTIVPEKAHI